MESNSGKAVVVCGGGGFIGGHLVAELRKQGCKTIRSVDIKPLAEWYQVFDDVENLQLDLSEKHACEKAVARCDLVYNLAADMGGMGFIETHKALCMLSVLINTHLLMAASALSRLQIRIDWPQAPQLQGASGENRVRVPIELMRRRR